MESDCLQCGNMKLAHIALLEGKKEERRMRDLSLVDSVVLQALAEHQVAQDAEDRKRQCEVGEANARTIRLKDVTRELAKKTAELAQKKRAIADDDGASEAR